MSVLLMGFFLGVSVTGLLAGIATGRGPWSGGAASCWAHVMMIGAVLGGAIFIWWAVQG